MKKVVLSFDVPMNIAPVMLATYELLCSNEEMSVEGFSRLGELYDQVIDGLAGHDELGQAIDKKELRRLQKRLDWLKERRRQAEEAEKGGSDVR